jgi:FAD/FMN-containing dehydrogenase
MNALRQELAQIVGPAHVADDAASRELMSADIWTQGAMPATIVSPADAQELARVVAVAARHSAPIVPRGGGMSYTAGYVTGAPNAVLVDLRRMDRILEIDASAMTVRVEAGVTWAQLHEALKAKGLRTPFWGPLSGISSTIGGGLSQNNAFFGAGLYGPSSDSVLGLSVVLADGAILHTDHRKAGDARHAFPQYGPNLTGLFLSDCGALGIKTEATLRLIPSPEFEDWLSFAFTTRDACAETLAAMSRENVACELFGFDPNLAKVRMRRASLLADVTSLAKVVTAQKSMLGGIVEGAKVALAGRSFIGGTDYTLHAVVEGRSAASVADAAARLRAVAKRHDGQEIENTIPKVIRANPFTPLNNILGPDGERWAPIHGIVSLTDGPAVWAEIDDLFAKMQDQFAARSIATGYLVTTLGTTGYLIEPVFFWPEARYAIHETTVEPHLLKRLPRHAANPEATALVKDARSLILDIFERAGAAHFQIGRTYRFAATREPVQLALLRALKAALDPKNLMNPGVLGL